MKKLWIVTLGVRALAAVALVTQFAHAQTVSNGPYYATPSWDQTLACASLASCPRFVVLANFNSEAVLDRETGIVWARAPLTSTYPWSDARFECMNRNIGGRKGWRLPTFDELNSLVDPSSPSLVLPAGHPFTNVGSGSDIRSYWTATRLPDDTGFALRVTFFFGLGAQTDAGLRNTPYYVWCARGASHAFVY